MPAAGPGLAQPLDIRLRHHHGPVVGALLRLTKVGIGPEQQAAEKQEVHQRLTLPVGQSTSRGTRAVDLGHDQAALQRLRLVIGFVYLAIR